MLALYAFRRFTPTSKPNPETLRAVVNLLDQFPEAPFCSVLIRAEMLFVPLSWALCCPLSWWSPWSLTVVEGVDQQLLREATWDVWFLSFGLFKMSPLPSSIV